VKTGNNARNGGKNSLNRLIRCVCGKKIGPDPRNFNQRVSLGRNDLLIRTFLRFRPGFSVKRMKFTDLKIETQASHQCFFYQGRLFRQHDEFTCLTHFPSPLAML
ncbi:MULTISPECIES: hypothetical protein, partial [Escherichia]